jgi:hypothetical protein
MLDVIPVFIQRACMIGAVERPFDHHRSQEHRGLAPFGAVYVRVNRGCLFLCRSLRLGDNEIVESFYMDAPQPFTHFHVSEWGSESRATALAVHADLLLHGAHDLLLL